MSSDVNNPTDYATKSDVHDLVDRFNQRSGVVDKRFEAVDKRFDAVDERFDAVDQRFEALDKKIDDRFDDVIGLLQAFMVQVSDEFEKVHAEQRAMRRDIDRIMSHLDSIEKRLEISEDERLVMGHQLKRLQVWTEHLADKIGVDLTKIKA